MDFSGFYGKGSFLWMSSRLGDKRKAVQKMVDAGLKRIDIKISDGALPFEIDRSTGFDHTAEMIPLLREAGIHVTAWSYIYGATADYVRREAAMAIQRLKQFEIKDFIINAEVQFKRPNHNKYADYFCRDLRNALPDLCVGLSSYRFPTLHMDFPWSAFWPYVDFHSPQVYWINAHNPVGQLDRSLRELKALNDIPFFPAGYGYGGVSASEMNDFDTAVKERGLKGITWWEWYYIQDKPEYYEAFKSHNWENEEQPPVVEPPVVDPPIVIDPPIIIPPVVENPEVAELQLRLAKAKEKVAEMQEKTDQLLKILDGV